MVLSKWNLCMAITCVKVPAQTDSIGLKADPFYNADCLIKSRA